MSTLPRARLWKGPTGWNYQVFVDGRVVFADNCVIYDKTMSAARRDVAVARRVVNAGHKFAHTWAELVAAVS